MTSDEFLAKYHELNEEYSDVRPQDWEVSQIPNDMLWEHELLPTTPQRVLDFCKRKDDLREEYYGDLMARRYYNCVSKGKKKEWMRRLKEAYDETTRELEKSGVGRI
ncbi:MAG: hypothetical protein Q4C70_06965 [Planctomycetia bacterium]|nr:hypothetical protein [Planctomycetia bacterium]